MHQISLNEKLIEELTSEKKTVLLATNLGDIEIELYWNHAPIACLNFLRLIESSYYSGCKFHKVAKNYIAQTGDPTNTGFGGQSIFGREFKDEISDELRFTGAGIVAMANAGPNKNNSQFFITLGLTPDLNNKYTIFGRVSKGIDTLSKINNIEVDQYKPKFDIVILSKDNRSIINSNSMMIKQT